MAVSQPVEPFAEVHSRPLPDGSLQIEASMLWEPDIEGAACGLALDASVSMRKFYGALPGVSPLFQTDEQSPNVVEPVARTLAAYLARFAGEGTCQVLYGSCGAEGAEVEDIGNVRENEARGLRITGPRRHTWGRQTRLLPPLRALVNGVFPGAPWALGVFVTDGGIDDLADVQRASLEWARQMARGDREPFQLVLIGLGDPVQTASLIALRDLFQENPLLTPQGQPIRLWNFKLAAQMRRLEELFCNAPVPPQTTLAPWARILGPDGRLAAEFRDGVPTRLCFRLPAGSRSFTLELPGGRVQQNLAADERV
ncbi:MAG: hypothetical protein SNJ82_05830 [Gemmataceae bacterium]